MKRQFAFPILAVLAVAALGLSMLFLYNSTFAQTGVQQPVMYAEDRTDPVLTLRADDPEGVSPIVWSIYVHDADVPGGDGGIQDIDGDGDDDVVMADAADAMYFGVSDNGELTFGSPNFEMPRGEALTADNTNTYKVVVQASDGGVTDKLNWFKVTVNVTDVEEEGVLAEWTVDADGDANTPIQTPNELLQFKPGAILTVVNPTDDDGGVDNIRWQWYRSSSQTADGDLIDGEVSATYTAQDTSDDNDVGMYLRVVATYDDRRGFNKTAEYVSENPVQAARNNENTPPTFPLYNVTRGIEENSKGDIGSPVTGTDDDVSDQSAVADILTYSLLPAANGNDNDTFGIHRATGQLNVAGLDFETPTDEGLDDDDANGDGDNTYVVRLKATDSSGADSATVTVVITVTDVNEEPTFGIDGADGGIAGMAPDHREDSLDADDMVDLTISTYTASDPEEGDVTLSLTGDDAGMFELAPDSIPGLNASRVLSFKAKPDFEMPGDSNSDNIYEVTVVASDGVNTDTRSVTVKVTDADEGGKVTLWSQDALTQDALIGVELTATLADSDGGVPDEDRFMRQAWEWQKATPDQGDTCEDTNAGENATWAEAGSGSTYTPKAGDRDDCLRAMVTYTDRTRDTDNMPENNVADPDGNPATDDAFVGFTNTATSDATTQVRNNPMNQAPEFTDGTSTFRLVEENTKALSGDADDDAADAADNPADNVGGLPVTATDDDDDMVAYTLGGRDKDMFRVRANGQLEVSAKAKLDHETKPSHTVTVMADDNYGEANSISTITVTIYVTDVDEPPTIADAGDPTVKDNRQSVMYAEDRTDPVLTLRADDPEGVSPIVWSIYVHDADVPGGDGGIQDIDGDGDDDVVMADAADAMYFGVSDNGELTFGSPNFEMPRGEALTADNTNTYKVVVQASDGGVTDKLNWFKVTVNVTDVEEEGVLAEWTVDADGDANTPIQTPNELLQFKPGAILTVVNPTDDDGGVDNIRWQWYRSSSQTADGDLIDGEVSATYTAQDTSDDNDVGMYLRVVATYDDRNGDDKTAEYVSENPVQATRSDVNTAPTFSLYNVARRIAENTKGDIGSPVTGTDADVRDQSAVADILTYSLLPAANGNDNDTFGIHRATGQLNVAGLDFETPTDEGLDDDDANGDGDNTYVVRLKATDSSGADSATVTVVITVTDVNEEPTFGIDGADGGIAGMAPDHREDSLDADDMVDLTISTYTASDPEEGDVTLSLTGDDAGMFELAPDSIPGLNASRVLSFKAKPDFEMPGDSNSDNIYEVTVVASDGVNTDTRSVTVKVTDADEGGKVTLWSQDALTQDALIGVELTATLADSDGGVPDEDRFMRQAWEWQKATPDQGDTCEDTNAGENATWAEAGSGSTYTPKAGDRGDCLRAMVTYTDRTRDTDNMPENNVADPDGNPATDDAFVGFTNTAMSDATTQVRNNPMNQAPEFADGATTFRLVEENTKALSGTADDDATDDNPADNVGGLPVMATDDNDGDTVAYTLGGLDKDMFRVRANGQLEVSAKANLDHETKSSHTITLTATDSSNTVNDSATITVTIYVTDLDERPVIASRASAPGENNAPRFRVATTGRSVEENTAVGMPIGDPVTANDADNDTLTYELGGADRASFDINTDTGQLMTSAMLDYETKASYSVTVTASDGTDTDTITVTITITDVVVEDTTPVTDGTLLERYAGDDGILQRGEVIDAIDDYLDAGDGAPSRGDVIELIDLYLDSGS